MKTYNVYRFARLAGCCLSISSVFASPVAFAQTPMNPIAIAAHPVPDQILSQIIGRGVLGGTIVYFGVEMQTNWTSPSSKTPMSSSMNVALNSQGNIFKPTITYTVDGTIPRSQSSTDNMVNGEGLNNIKGVTQAIQIGGNDNSVSNGMSLNVIQGTPKLTRSAGVPISLGQHTDHGVTLTVLPGQLSMALSNGATRIRQGIGSNGVFQTSQVGSDMNNIQNHMALTLGINSAKANTMNPGQLQSILSTMRGIQ